LIVWNQTYLRETQITLDILEPRLSKCHSVFFRDQECIRNVRERHMKIFGENFRSIASNNYYALLLVDPYYHVNFGGFMLTLGKLEFVEHALQLREVLPTVAISKRWIGSIQIVGNSECQTGSVACWRKL
jgi:hypothetical protein